MDRFYILLQWLNCYLCAVLKSLKKYISENNLLLDNEYVLVAVSGGVDSVVLLDLLVKAGYRVAIIHCNFKLRGNESDDDEKFVSQLAKKYNRSLYVKHCPAYEFAKKHKLAIQEAARELRYNFFEKLSKQKDNIKVAIAHHADDNLETFFINLFRGSGLQGLKGIPVQRGIYIRPLMFTTRRQIETYARDNNLNWRNDTSNDALKYLRNKIRHNLLPEIKKITGNFNTIFQSLDNLKDDALVLDNLLNSEKNKYLDIKNNQTFIKPFEIPSNIPSDLWFYYLLKEYGFSRNETDKIFAAFKSRSVGKHFFAEHYELLVDREQLIVRKRISVSGQKYFITQNDAFISKPFNASIKVVSGNVIDPTLFKNSNFGFFDFDKLSFPLILRTWHEGDRFQPYGLKGSKLVSDFLTDLKLSLFDKEEVWIMESGGVIVWIVGYRIADPYKITESTENVFLIQLTG